MPEVLFTEAGFHIGDRPLTDIGLYVKPASVRDEILIFAEQWRLQPGETGASVTEKSLIWLN